MYLCFLVAYMQFIVACGEGQVDDQTEFLVFFVQSVQQLPGTKDIRTWKLMVQRLKKNTQIFISTRKISQTQFLKEALCQNQPWTDFSWNSWPVSEALWRQWNESREVFSQQLCNPAIYWEEKHQVTYRCEWFNHFNKDDSGDILYFSSCAQSTNSECIH